jgi:hypothetical protein
MPRVYRSCRTTDGISRAHPLQQLLNPQVSIGVAPSSAAGAAAAAVGAAGAAAWSPH